MNKVRILFLSVFLVLLATPAFAGDTVWLDTLPLDQVLQTGAWAQPQHNLNYIRGPLTIDGVSYRFVVGMDGQSVWQSGVMTHVDQAIAVDIDTAMKLVVGDILALTPPMGWSSWNAWCANPNRQRVLDAANSLVKFDLIDHGFTYVNIDDGWQAARGGKFNAIQPQLGKFPDFPQMVNRVHELGLKFGVYLGQWIFSYCGSRRLQPLTWLLLLCRQPDRVWVERQVRRARSLATEKPG